MREIQKASPGVDSNTVRATDAAYCSLAYVQHHSETMAAVLQE